MHGSIKRDSTPRTSDGYQSAVTANDEPSTNIAGEPEATTNAESAASPVDAGDIQSIPATVDQESSAPATASAPAEVVTYPPTSAIGVSDPTEDPAAPGGSVRPILRAGKFLKGVLCLS